MINARLGNDFGIDWVKNILSGGKHEVAYKSRYQEDERALRLVEIGDHFVYKAELEARDNDDAGACGERIPPLPVQVVHNGLQGLLRGVGIVPLIGSPLGNIGRIAVFNAAYTYIIEGFQRAYRVW